MAKTEQSIDINSAAPDELTQIEGINSERARLLVAYRAKHGPFKSWQEVGAIPGIGQALIKKVQQMASLGDGRGQPARAGAAAQDEGDEDDESAEADGDIEIEALMALARMDLEAAIAYGIAAGAMDDPEIADQLNAFRKDHMRHVDDLGSLVTDRGGRALKSSDHPDDSALTALAQAASGVGARASILAMISNERLTNSVYEAILEIGWDDEAEEVLLRNRSDEQKHLAWLEQNRDRVVDEQPVVLA